jgi:putative hydrolase of the HAD superfamily
VVIEGLVFDLDDTLSYERDYVRSGFNRVARLVAPTEVDWTTLSEWLWTAFESGVRGDTFDRLFEAFPQLANRWTIQDVVRAYREHDPDIELIPEAARTLDALQRRGLRLAVLSDGPAASQAAKATALGLDRWFDPIILTGALGAAYAKPATAGFELISSAWGVPGQTLAYVADNPAKDFAGPRQLGWTTIRLRDPLQLRFSLEPAEPAFRPDAEIEALDELLRLLPSAAERDAAS